MSIYSRIEKLLKYRLNRTLSKGILRKQNFERLSFFILLGFFLIFLSGLPGVTEVNMPRTALFFVINIIYAVSIVLILRNIESKSRDYFLVLVGTAILVLTLLFNIWIGFIR